MAAPIGGIWAPLALRIVRSTALKATKLIQSKLANAARPAHAARAALEPAYVRASTRQPVHPAAFLRQQKNRRWHSTTSSTFNNINAAVRRFISTGRLEGDGVPRIVRSKFLNTQTGRAVSQITGRAPFASTLRPNLTGGALPRTAGGYGLGSGRIGGARYFSHAPASQAQVFQNVSAAVRAFWISGQKAQFDGFNARGERQYRAVSPLQHEASAKMASVPHHTAGSHVDFRLSPVITSLSSLTGSFPYKSAAAQAPLLCTASLNTEGFLDVLSVDFARALQDLTATLADIKKLSALGDLPIQLVKGPTLRVCFPGVDADTVESLCDDLGLTRGVVREDSNFNAEIGATMALKFPYAPDDLVVDKPGLVELPPFSFSLRSGNSSADDCDFLEGFSALGNNPWLEAAGSESFQTVSSPGGPGDNYSQESEGLEGVYRFLEECDRAHGAYMMAV
ncbi:hypothetical protein GGR50DRAFT_187676 [Xylaria sp. CBS 124048]|nr:hypothetical protein GGR50DRAFT_187676 [Xylaria sp. CBS 124048]